eukprot:scaffold64719_cov37-Tisochrysis_lutea.AAC.1
MKKKEKKRGGKKGKGKGKSKAAMAEPPSIPPDAIGLSVLLLEAGADPRIQDTTGQSQPRWVHEVTKSSGHILHALVPVSSYTKQRTVGMQPVAIHSRHTFLLIIFFLLHN